MKYLVSTSDIETMIHDMVASEYGQCFASQVTITMEKLVEFYNRTESAELVDAVIESMKEGVIDYSPVDLIAEQFTRLVEVGIDLATHVASLEYDPMNETIMVTQRKRPEPKTINKIKEDYHHAQAHGDFIPERLRRAFEELVSSNL